MSEKMLGKISGASFGFGGYDGAQFGLTLTFSGNGVGVGTFVGFWANKPTEHTKWTAEDQVRYFGETCVKLIQTLADAKKRDVSELVGVPVELTFTGNMLTDWRVLTEVV